MKLTNHELLAIIECLSKDIDQLTIDVDRMETDLEDNYWDIYPHHEDMQKTINKKTRYLGNLINARAKFQQLLQDSFAPEVT